MQSTFHKSYTSFSGVDIKAVGPGGVAMGTLQAISHSVTREKAGIWTMGNANCRGYSRGKRGMGGSMIFILLNQEPLTSIKGISQRLVQLDTDEIIPEFADSTGGDLSLQFSAASGIQAGTPLPDAESDLTSVSSDQYLTYGWYPDQFPPFDVTLVGNNEAGAMMKMAITGVEILNSAGGVSIDDIVNECEYTYVAREIAHWRPVTPDNMDRVGLSE